jgi:hypothetical protein
MPVTARDALAFGIGSITTIATISSAVYAVVYIKPVRARAFRLFVKRAYLFFSRIRFLGFFFFDFDFDFDWGARF